MWQQHTREKPAKRGWSLAAMLILFLGTLAAAWAVTLSRSGSTPLVEQRIPVDWPFSFAVPADYRLFETVWFPKGAPEGARTAGHMIFALGEGTASESKLVVAFDRIDANASLTEVAAQFTDAPISVGDPIAMGTLRGRWIDHEGSGILLAVAKSETGLATAVMFGSSRVNSRNIEMFESVCASIELIR